jgi:hypothetical protein
MTKKLEILIASLEKKEAMFNQKLDDNIATVKQANGQPLNDKRNGRATLNKWESQNNSLKSLQLEIEKTKRAIENETAKIKNVEHTQNILPSQIIDLISEGTLIQWRKYPNMFFVEGVEIARIIWNAKKKILEHKYFNLVIDIEQRKKFANIFNQLYNSLR